MNFSINTSPELAFPTVDLNEIKPSPDALDAVQPEFAIQRQVLPFATENGILYVAIGTVENLGAVDELGLVLGMPVRAVIGDTQRIRELIEELFLEKILSDLPGNSDGAAATEIDDTTDLADLQKMAGETAVVQMVNLIFAQAIRDGASDIHIEPYEREVKVRSRVDGMLRSTLNPPKRMHAALISRLKILGEMNIAERRLPQDGRIKLVIAGRSIDVRVSIVPTVFGERAVMRILDKGTAMLGLEELGMRPDLLAHYRDLIHTPYGVVLVTGPTGSGKSTTLYASLQEIWSPTTNILTIEDPVEYQVTGISQIQVRPNIGLTFASGLRSIVRQDPDVIMVGEIRDHETAEISIHAALTGHLVFSTLHTNDAPGSITRMLDMGVEPYLVASSLIGAVAQRLVRRLCPVCSAPDTPTEASLRAIGVTHEMAATATFRRGIGCDKCQNTGYKGRQALYELFHVDEPIRRMTVERANSTQLRDHAIAAYGMRTLLGDGRLSVMDGKTTPEEVLRVCQRDGL